MKSSTKKPTMLFWILVSSLLILFPLQGIAASDVLADQAIVPKQTTSVSFEVLPSPQLEDNVEIHYHGSAGEFEALHVDTGGISSYVNLTWTHVAGTGLNLTSDEIPFLSERDELPYYWDFCYFSMSFEWIYEDMPIDAMFYVTYSIHASGDFNSTDGELMFKIYSWLIDSSDDWACMYESESPYSTASHLYSYDLNYFDLHPGWAGMTENADGAQEDPTDILTVAVGLAMSESFGDLFDSSYPWEVYNGSVSALISSMSLVVEMEPVPDTPPIQIYSAAGVVTVVIVIIGYGIWRDSKKKV